MHNDGLGLIWMNKSFPLTKYATLSDSFLKAYKFTVGEASLMDIDNVTVAR